MSVFLLLKRHQMGLRASQALWCREWDELVCVLPAECLAVAATAPAKRSCF